jgi:mRNA interferase RelE/StbE
MNQYSVAFQPSVEKDLRQLSSVVRKRVLTKIEALGSDPPPPKTTKLKNTDGLYRVRVGDHRIVYEVDHAIQQVLIHYVRHRSEVYRDL